MDLERLAQLIKCPGVKASVTEGGALRVEIIGSRLVYFCPEKSDDFNAPWFIWCLDYLERLGLAPILQSEHPAGYCIHWLNPNGTWHQDILGSTRAEVATNALLKALESCKDDPATATCPELLDLEKKADR